MKAIVYTTYGSPDVLKFEEVKKPVPRDDEVLIKVYAAALNSWDWDRLTGKPYIYRLLSGFSNPKLTILGADVAGKIEATGKKVKKFQPGDNVFGDMSVYGWGGFAEYVCASENALALKPSSMTFEEAAAIPQASVMALQGIRDYGKVKPGQKVLINGAGGGVGTFAIQIAKHFGAEVTSVDSSVKLDKLLSIGSDHVIDYTQVNFTRQGLQYDVIIDVAAQHSVFDYKRALNRGGIYVMIGGSLPSILQILLLGPWISITGDKKIGILAHKPNKDLAFLVKLFENGKLTPVIDRQFTLSETPEAFRYFNQGLHRGKIVITL